MGYIKLFNNIAAYLNYINGEPLLPNVSLVEEDDIVFYNPGEVVSYEYENEYLYFEALEDGMTVSFTNRNNSGSLYYSLDKQEWNESTGETPTVNSGEKIYFKGVNLVPGAKSGIGSFTINKQCNVAGNVMSLLFGDNFIGQTDLTGYNYVFYRLFYSCRTIQSVKNLILPATTLADQCYRGMFQDCTSLTSAPELPATTLARSCYYFMFSGCTKLQVLTKSEFILSNDMAFINSGFNGIFKDCYMPKNQNVIINLSDSDEVIFNYSNGIYSALREETILTDILSQEDISTLTPEYDLVVTVYDNYPDPHIVNTPNICEHITWEAGQSLEEFAEKFNFDYNNTSISILYTSRKGGDYYYYYD